MELIPVEGNSSLFRDKKTGAIINCSSNDYDSYLQSKIAKLKEIDQIENLKHQVSEIDKLKSDMNEIKDIMKLIVSKLDLQ